MIIVSDIVGWKTVSVEQKWKIITLFVCGYVDILYVLTLQVKRIQLLEQSPTFTLPKQHS